MATIRIPTAPARPSRPVVVAALACALLASRTASAQRDESALGRWTSFTKLVESRWTDRANGLVNEPDVGDALARCLDDAWFLGLTSIASGAENAACTQLLRPRGVKPAKRAVVAEWRARMSRADRPVTDDDWAACSAEVRKYQDDALLAACGLALKPRKQQGNALPDTERFDRWLQDCKAALALDPPPAPKPEPTPDAKPATEATSDAGTAPAPAPVEEPPALAPIAPDALAHARHCHRLLPTFYEVNGLKKASTYFTPAQLKVLTRRMKELAQDDSGRGR